MKINPDSFPIIIIAAFAFGLILAMALGFRPHYGSIEESRQDRRIPGHIMVVETLVSTIQ